MVTAFCPGHITCFFKPAGEPGENILSRGSIGAGIRTSLGARVEVIERSDSRLCVTMDGEPVQASVTEAVFRELVPDRGFEVTVLNELPCGEGFGMSAAGAIASALCVADLCGLTVQKAYEAAHVAEIVGGGGLGDVSAIYRSSHQPVRIRQGIPPYGEVVGTDVQFDELNLVVLGPKMHTGNLLGRKDVFESIVRAGGEAVSQYLSDPSEPMLYSLSNRFSKAAGVESAEVSSALEKLNRAGYHAAMCMLGNSLFTDAPSDILEHMLGHVQVHRCASTDAPAEVIRKG